MLKEARKVWGAYQAARDGHSLVTVEGPTHCNRSCIYCGVHNRQNTHRFSTVAETLRQVDWSHDEGFRFLQYVGGEPLAGCQYNGGIRQQAYELCPLSYPILVDYRESLTPFITDEGITYVDHALKVIKHASARDMIASIITNGDFLDNLTYLSKLKKAGLDILEFSLQSPTEAGIKGIIGKARAVANEGIIPTVSVVFTKDRADIIPKVAKTCVVNGVFFSMCLVQEIGDGFSTVPARSNTPTTEQIKQVCQKLEPLRKSRFLINTRGYFEKAMHPEDNLWRCDPKQDQFVHLRAVEEKGEIGACSDKRTGLDTSVSLKSPGWRERKEEVVKDCHCLYYCYFRCQNHDFRNDLRLLLPMVLIKSGHAGFARALGRRAVEDFTDVITVPQSSLEKSQAWWKNYNKLHNKIKRRGGDLIEMAATPFVYAAFLGTYGLVSAIARRKGISQEAVDRAMLKGIVYPGVATGPDDKSGS